MSENLALLREWYRRVWEKEDTAAIDFMLAEDFVIKGLEEQHLTGKDEFKMFHKMVLALLRDIRVSIDQHISDGPWISARLIMRAKARSGERSISVASHVMIHFKDQKIVEAHNLIDFFTAFTQLGFLPERALDRCLLGQRLAFV